MEAKGYDLSWDRDIYDILEMDYPADLRRELDALQQQEVGGWMEGEEEPEDNEDDNEDDSEEDEEEETEEPLQPNRGARIQEDAVMISGDPAFELDGELDNSQDMDGGDY